MSFVSLHYHVVFATKERACFLHGEKLTRMLEYLGGIAREHHGIVACAGGMPDHVHLLISIPPVVAVADFIGKLKALSSGWTHRTFNDLALFSWQDGYAAFTVSPSVIPSLRRYIETQIAHHQKTDSLTELIRLLNKHGIVYDEKYLR